MFHLNEIISVYSSNLAKMATFSSRKKGFNMKWTTFEILSVYKLINRLVQESLFNML